MSSYPFARIGDVVENRDRLRVPLSSRERAKRKGRYPYYGAAGLLDAVDDFIFEGPHLLIAEDGSVALESGKPVLQLVDGRFWVNNHAHVLRGDDELDTRYVFYGLRTIPIGPYLTGSVQFKLSQANLNRIEIPYPARPVRRAIAGVLGALDDKIELNRRMNETLERIAIIHFRSLMRKPWPISKLGDSFRVTMGQSPPGSSYNEVGEGVVFFQGRAEFGSRYPAPRLYCTAPTRLAEAGDALVSVRAPVGDVNMAETDCCIGRGLAAVRHATGSRSFSYYAMKSLSAVFDVFEGEGTVFGSISKNQFLLLPWPEAAAEDVSAFEVQVAPVDSLIEANHRQSRTLAELRDTLLPKLISGELRVRDA